MRLRFMLGSTATLALALPAVGMGAVAAVQDDRLPVAPIGQIGQRIDRIASSGAKVARVDIARKLAEAIWHILTKNEPFAPAGPTMRLVA